MFSNRWFGSATSKARPEAASVSDTKPNPGGAIVIH